MSVSPERQRFGGNALIGTPLDRVDGRLKVTGAATYAAEWPIEHLAHGVLVGSAVASGRISAIDSSAAEAAPGVLAVITHLNGPKLPAMKSFLSGEGAAVQLVQPLQDETIHYAGQHVAVVVAETLEQARQAADLLRVEYEEQPPRAELEAHLDEAYPHAPFFGGTEADTRRGDAAAALAAAEVRLEQRYSTPIEHHNPMEPHATLAQWEADGRLTVYDATQGVNATKMGLCEALGLPPDRVRVISPFIGGGFGCKGTYWPHIALTAVAAQRVGRPVKLVLTRAQLYTSNGYRSATLQQVSLGARRDGTLQAIVHRSTSIGSAVGEFPEMATGASRMLYACPNVETSQRLVRLNLGVPSPMRAPGEAPSVYGLESALDELAFALGLDPLELRLRNYAEVDPESGRPWSSKSLRECYARGAEAFGWSRRSPEPASMRDGRFLLGWGLGTATYPSFSFPAMASAALDADGNAMVRSATADLGTGAYTVMTQVAAETLGLPPERVRFELGDSDFPFAFVAGGSTVTASVGPAVQTAASQVRERVISLALDDEDSPIHGYSLEDVAVENGRVFLRHEPTRGEEYRQIIRRHGGQPVEGSGGAQPSEAAQQYAMSAFGAHFVEVRVDPDLGLVRVGRVVSAIAAGRIVNPKTARSQIVGGVVGGIGMALLEQTAIHPRLGRVVSPNLSGYLVPVHADVPPIEVLFVEEHDPHVNPLGVKGIGEIGIVGVAPAIANAVFHATGKRVRDLPITPEKLL